MSHHSFELCVVLAWCDDLGIGGGDLVVPGERYDGSELPSRHVLLALHTLTPATINSDGSVQYWTNITN